MKRNCGYHHTRGYGKPSESDGEGGGCNLFQFLDILSHHFEKKICKLWSWNIQNMFELSFSSCISKKNDEITIFRTFVAKFWIFIYFHKKFYFQVYHVLLSHNYAKPLPIVLILVCMDRGDQYLSTGLKIRSKRGKAIFKGQLENCLWFWRAPKQF